MASVLDRIKQLGIGVKGPIQREIESDPYLTWMHKGPGQGPMTPEIMAAKRRYYANKASQQAPQDSGTELLSYVEDRTVKPTPSYSPAYGDLTKDMMTGLFNPPTTGTSMEVYGEPDISPINYIDTVEEPPLREVRAVLNDTPVVSSNIVDWMLEGQRNRIAEAQRTKRLNEQRAQEEFDRQQKEAVSKVQEAEMAVAERIVQQEKSRKANQLVADMEKALGEKQRELDYLRGQRQASGLFGGVPYSGYQPSPYNYVGDYSMSLMPGPDYSMSPVDSLYPNAMIPEYYLGDEGLTAAMLDPNSGLYDEAFAQTYNNPEYYKMR
jgi:hypothetical protein